MNDSYEKGNKTERKKMDEWKTYNAKNGDLGRKLCRLSMMYTWQNLELKRSFGIFTRIIRSDNFTKSYQLKIEIKYIEQKKEEYETSTLWEHTHAHTKGIPNGCMIVWKSFKITSKFKFHLKALERAQLKCKFHIMNCELPIHTWATQIKN